MKLNGDVTYGMPESLGISQEKYAKSVNKLIAKQRENDPTVAFRSQEELKKHYNNAIIAVFEDEIIGNAVIIPTNQMENTLQVNNETIQIGEVESVIVDPDHQGKSVGKHINAHVNQHLGSQYEVIILATMNEVMKAICNNLGYEDIGLSGSFDAEGRKFFVQSGVMSQEEYEQRATGMIKFNNGFNQSEKDHIKDLYLNS